MPLSLADGSQSHTGIIMNHERAPQRALVLNPDKTASYYTSAHAVCFNLIAFLKREALDLTVVSLWHAASFLRKKTSTFLDVFMELNVMEANTAHSFFPKVTAGAAMYIGTH